MNDYLIPRIEDATDVVFYRSRNTLEGYGLKSPQPRYFGWFDLDSGKGCHFNAKVFLGKRWVLGRYITGATRDKFLQMKAQWDDFDLDVDEFRLVMSIWLEAAGQEDVLEWWLQEA